MTDRDRLIELQLKAYKEWRNNTNLDISVAEFTTDYILADGWIRPPCKVGDTVWELYTQYNGNVIIREGKISMLAQKADKSWKVRITVNSSVWDFKVNDIGTRYFLTKEEAEEKLKELGK